MSEQFFLGSNQTYEAHGSNEFEEGECKDNVIFIIRFWIVLAFMFKGFEFIL